MSKEQEQTSEQTQEKEKQADAILRAEKLKVTIKKLEQAQVITHEILAKEFTI